MIEFVGIETHIKAMATGYLMALYCIEEIEYTLLDISFLTQHYDDITS